MSIICHQYLTKELLFLYSDTLLTWESLFNYINSIIMTESTLLLVHSLKFLIILDSKRAKYRIPDVTVFELPRAENEIIGSISPLLFEIHFCYKVIPPILATVV